MGISYSPQYADHLREIGVNIYQIGKLSNVVFGSSGCWNFKLMNGELLMSLTSRVGNISIEFYNFRLSNNIILCWENDGNFYTFRNEKIKNLLSKISFDFNKKLCSPGCIESNEYRVCMSITPPNFQKYIRKYPTLDLSELKDKYN